MFGGNKSAREQMRIVDSLRSKVAEKERYENDKARAEQKLKQNASDASAARDLQRAADWLERADREVERLKDQL